MTAALQSIANKALKSVYLSNTQGASSALKKAALALQAGSASSLQMSYALSSAASLVDVSIRAVSQTVLLPVVRLVARAELVEALAVLLLVLGVLVCPRAMKVRQLRPLAAGLLLAAELTLSGAVSGWKALAHPFTAMHVVAQLVAAHWVGPVWAQLMAAALELGWFFVDPTTANLKSLAELNSELRSWMAVYLLAKVVTVAARRRLGRRFLVIST